MKTTAARRQENPAAAGTAGARQDANARRIHMVAHVLFPDDDAGVTHAVVNFQSGRGLSIQNFVNRTEALDAAIALLPNGTVYRADAGVFLEADGRTVYVVKASTCADAPTVVF